MKIPSPENLDKKDYKFIVANPDSSFDPLRNKWVIESTIKKYEAKRRKQLYEAREGIKERADALASWATSDKGWRGDNPVTRYFSKRMISYLRGDELRHKLMGNAIQRNVDHLYRKLNAQKN